MRLRRPLVAGAVQGVDGQLTLYRAFDGAPHPCLHCLFGDTDDAASLPSCAQAGVLGPAAGLIGSLMAIEVIKALTGNGSGLSGTLLHVDALAPAIERLAFARRAGMRRWLLPPQLAGRPPSRPRFAVGKASLSKRVTIGRRGVAFSCMARWPWAKGTALLVTFETRGGRALIAGLDVRQRSRRHLEARMMNSLDADYRPTENEPYMNARQVEYFRRKLLAWRDELVRGSGLTLKQLQEDDAKPADASDWANTEVQRAFELRTRDRERKLLAKIEAALRRIDDGSYGYCEETQEPIGLKRLDARPIATLSIEAQERHERRERSHRDN